MTNKSDTPVLFPKKTTDDTIKALESITDASFNVEGAMSYLGHTMLQNTEGVGKYEKNLTTTVQTFQTVKSALNYAGPKGFEPSKLMEAALKLQEVGVATSQISSAVELLTVAYFGNQVALTGLIVAQKAGSFISGLTKCWGDATAALALLREGNSLASVAQVTLNGTFLACPATWIALGIMGLVVAGYYLIKNWDKVKAFFIGAATAIMKNWKKITTFFGNLGTKVKSIFTGVSKTIWKVFDNKYVRAAILGFAPFLILPEVIAKNWDKLKNGFATLWGGIKKGATAISVFVKRVMDSLLGSLKGLVNMLIGLLNSVIGGINKLKFKIPSWVPDYGGKSFGINIAKLPMLAKGTSYFQGGVALVGEKGPELLHLARGSQVVSNNRLAGLLNGRSDNEKNNGITVAIHQNFYGQADKDQVKAANKESMAEFERKFNALMQQRNRLKFA